MDKDLQDLHIALRIVTTVGYIATGALMIGVLYVLHKRYFGEDARKYRWVFVLVATITALIFVYMYGFFFNTDPSVIRQMILNSTSGY